MLCLCLLLICILVFEIPPKAVDQNQECQCGQLLNNQQVQKTQFISNLANKIVGGNPAVKNSIPWQVAIIDGGISNEQFCGGTIIGPKTILSAAHCFASESGSTLKPPQGYKVIVGVNDLGNQIEKIKG